MINMEYVIGAIYSCKYFLSRAQMELRRFRDIHPESIQTTPIFGDTHLISL